VSPVQAAAQPDEKVGRLGAHKRGEALLTQNVGLAQENADLRARVDALLGMSAAQVAAEADRVREQIQARVAAARAELAVVQGHAAEAVKVRDAALAETRTAMESLRVARAQVIATDEVAALQEVGIYELTSSGKLHGSVQSRQPTVTGTGLQRRQSAGLRHITLTSGN
jgi:hypothetical protein